MRLAFSINWTTLLPVGPLPSAAGFYKLWSYTDRMASRLEQALNGLEEALAELSAAADAARSADNLATAPTPDSQLAEQDRADLDAIRTNLERAASLLQTSQPPDQKEPS